MESECDGMRAELRASHTSLAELQAEEAAVVNDAKLAREGAAQSQRGLEEEVARLREELQAREAELQAKEVTGYTPSPGRSCWDFGLSQAERANLEESLTSVRHELAASIRSQAHEEASLEQQVRLASLCCMTADPPFASRSC